MSATVRHALVVLVLGATLPVSVAAQQTQTMPVPKPFPGAGAPPASPPAGRSPAPPTAQTPAIRPALPAEQSGSPTDAMLGVPGIIYPASEFLESFDAGKGQRAYLFGTNASFAEMIAYYKQILKDGGRELFKAPPMQQFDLGKFQDQSMVYTPSVVVKDYSYGGQEGYLHVDGITEHRFKTVIQIVPASGR